MTQLVECRGCTRHVRVADSRCPFCGRASTTSAPMRSLVLALPLTLMACGDATTTPPPAKAVPATDVPAKAEPTPEPKPTPKPEPTPEPVPEDVPPPTPEPAGSSGPSDDGAIADPPPEAPIDRPMATKYGGPPAMDPPRPMPEPRPAPKYGAPPPPPKPEPKPGG